MFTSVLKCVPVTRIIYDLHIQNWTEIASRRMDFKFLSLPDAGMFNRGDISRSFIGKRVWTFSGQKYLYARVNNVGWILSLVSVFAEFKL